MNKLDKVHERVIKIRQKCPSRMSRYGIFPSKGGDGGDDCLWLGLLSSAGFVIATNGLANCQALHGEKYPGMFYRNPVRRETHNSGYSHFFSRDMAMGVLCAYAAHKQRFDSSQLMWLNHINAIRACAVKKPKWMGGGCLIRSPMYRYAKDDRSDITPAMWALMGRVWEHNGWPKHKCMDTYKYADGDISKESAKIVPIGYQLHLLAVGAYLKWMLKQSRAIRQEVSSTCYIRQPDNLFYKIVAQEKVIDSDMETFLERCPNPDTFVPRDYWLWEKDDQDPYYSCGWDWVFLGYLIIRIKTGTFGLPPSLTTGEYDFF